MNLDKNSIKLTVDNYHYTILYYAFIRKTNSKHEKISKYIKGDIRAEKYSKEVWMLPNETTHYILIVQST